MAKRKRARISRTASQSRRAKKKTRPPRRRATPQPAARRAGGDSGLAPGMQALNTYLAVANVNASVEFLEKAFGFARGVVLNGADGKARYAEMRHGNSVVMLIRRGDATAATSGAAALYTYVEDVDHALARARGAGAGVDPAEDKPWGDRAGTVTDPDGYRWVLATFKKLAPFS
jgi:uncharacterized glyoxalase superfamily protein PhnB